VIKTDKPLGYVEITRDLFDSIVTQDDIVTAIHGAGGISRITYTKFGTELLKLQQNGIDQFYIKDINA